MSGSPDALPRTPTLMAGSPERRGAPSDPRATIPDIPPEAPKVGCAAILGEALGRLRATPLRFLGEWLLIRVLAAAVIAPLASWATNWMIARTGRYVVANEDIVRFVLTPLGVAVLALAAGVTVVSLSMARAGTLLIAWRDDRQGPARFRQRRVGAIAHGVVGAARRMSTIAWLAARQIAVLALVSAPLVAVMAVVAWLVMRDVDKYWLVTTRPTRFWIGVLALAPCAIALAALAGLRLLRWSIALPLCILEAQRPAAAMRESARVLRGRLPLVAATRGAWFAAVAAVTAALMAVVLLLSELALARELGSLTLTAVAAGVAMLAHAVVLTAEGMVAGVGDTLLVYALWRRLSPGAAGVLARPEGSDEGASATAVPGAAMRWVIPAGAAFAAFVAAAASVGIVASVDRPISVELTAHRGASRVAPENTRASILEAIRLGADRVEIDVMLTQDGALVLFHDIDLRRIANDPRRIAETTLSEIQQLDVGSWFDPAFAAERAPTLDQVLTMIEEIGATDSGRPGGTPLNIELKTRGDDDLLARRVAETLRRHGDVASIVTSLSTRALEAYRREDPQRRIGAIVSTSIGDIRRLDVDLYAVSVGLATPALIAAADHDSRQVHAWTVTDPDTLTQLVLRGVDGVITSDVEPMRRRLKELAELDELERLLLAFRARLRE